MKLFEKSCGPNSDKNHVKSEPQSDFIQCPLHLSACLFHLSWLSLSNIKTRWCSYCWPNWAIFKNKKKDSKGPHLLQNGRYRYSRISMQWWLGISFLAFALWNFLEKNCQFVGKNGQTPEVLQTYLQAGTKFYNGKQRQCQNRYWVLQILWNYNITCQILSKWVNPQYVLQIFL